MRVAASIIAHNHQHRPKMSRFLYKNRDTCRIIKSGAEVKRLARIDGLREMARAS